MWGYRSGFVTGAWDKRTLSPDRHLVCLGVDVGGLSADAAFNTIAHGFDQRWVFFALSRRDDAVPDPR